MYRRVAKEVGARNKTLFLLKIKCILSATMDKNLFNRLVYFDHNILDRMTKGEYLGFVDLIKQNNLIAAYSSESLNEIKRSEGYQNSFLDILKAMDARHIVPNTDENFKYIGTAQVLEADPYDVYQSYIDDCKNLPKHGYGLADMLQKMYGGMADTTFSKIFEKGVKEAIESIQILESDIDVLDLSIEEKNNIKSYFRILPDFLEKEYSELGNMLDSNSVENSVKNLEKITGLGPKVLKNISGHNLLIQVWGHVQKALPMEGQTLEKFFGIETDRDLSIVEKANSIYHQLNYIGFYRDSNMKKERRFIASFSDMTHAGIATFCRYFFCKDKDLVMKASAAYEYLGLQTQIVYIQDNNNS
jgi:hypothetical protein